MSLRNVAHSANAGTAVFFCDPATQVINAIDQSRRISDNMRHRREFIGEALGTYVLVLFGCGSVAVSVLFDAHQGLMQVALAWGIGVMLAIYLTRHLSCAHLNPAVSLAMYMNGSLNPMNLFSYVFAQLLGGFSAYYAYKMSKRM